MSLYSSLYPKLQFGQNKSISNRSMGILNSLGVNRSLSQPRQSSQPRSVEQVQPIIKHTEPSIPLVPSQPVPEPVSLPIEPVAEPVAVPVVEKKVVVKEPAKPKAKPKAKQTRPNRVKGTVPKPDDPIRAKVQPGPGEQGFANKYSVEQRKAMYMERLSRKSVKNAEKEIGEVNEVLDRVGNCANELRIHEQAVKKQMKLINYAKFFADEKEKQPDEAMPSDDECTLNSDIE